MASKMSVTLAAELAEAWWAKHKGLVAKAKPTGIGEALKALKSADASVDRDVLSIDKLTQPDVMTSRLALIEAQLKKEVKAAADAAAQVAKLAAKAQSDFKASPLIPKSAGEAAGKVAAAARDYAATVQREAQTLRDELAQRLEEAKKAAQKLKAEAEKNKPEDDPMQSPQALEALAYVRSRTLPCIRAVRAQANQKGKGKPVPPPEFYAAVAPKQAALLMKPSVSESDKKRLQALLPGQSGIKYFKGTVVWENMAFTFVADNPVSGAAKKMQASLKQLFKITPKLRVRKSTGEVEAVDGDDNLKALDDFDEQGQDKASGGETAPNSPTDKAPGTAPKPGGSTIAELKELVDRANAAKKKIDDLIAAGGDLAKAVKQRMEEFATALGRREASRAREILDRVLDMAELGAPGTPSGGPQAKPQAPALDPAVVQQGQKADEDLAAAKVDVDALPAGSFRDGLEKERGDLGRLRASADKQPKAKAEQIITAVAKGAAALLLRTKDARTKAQDAQSKHKAWAADKVAALKSLIDGLSVEGKNAFKDRLKELQDLAAKALKDLQEGRYADSVKASSEAFYGCQATTTAANAFATDFPAYKAERDKIEKALADIRKDKAKADAVKNQLSRVEKELKQVDGFGPKSGYASAKDSLKDVNVTLKVVQASAAAYDKYQPERDKADKAITALKSHGQAKDIAAEIKEHEQALKDADKLGPGERGGWQKAIQALKILMEQVAATKSLADELAKVQAKLPDLTKALADEGIEKADAERMAGYAAKMLVQEKCSDADALKMAKDADQYRKDGLDETDALMSSRVKTSLTKQGIDETRAAAIGKNLRAGGNSNADDAKAVAMGMSKLSAKAVEELNKNGITTECCRGPVTQTLPELMGEHPRGWPDGATWDGVPGVFSGSNQKVVIGTMDDGGKRKVPGPSEGPVKHGTPDLIGHESGHAFDAAGGGSKRTNAAFLKAREDAIADGATQGMVPGTDNYFLTKAEGGTNTAGATSETFAESFAMHFAGNSKWKKLEDFWKANPWGV